MVISPMEVLSFARNIREVQSALEKDGAVVLELDERVQHEVELEPQARVRLARREREVAGVIRMLVEARVQ